MAISSGSPYPKMEIQSLPPSQAKQALRELNQFKESLAFQLFKADHEKARERGITTALNMKPKDLAQAVAREQTFGEISQLTQILSWIDNTILDLKDHLNRTENKNVQQTPNPTE